MPSGISKKTGKPLRPPAAGKGRKRGRPNKLSKKMLDEIARNQVAAARGRAKVPYSTPLEYMFWVLLDPKSSAGAKRWAAEKAAVFVHRKMPIAIEGGDPTKPLVLATMAQLSRLSPAQLRVLQNISVQIENTVPATADVMKQIAEKVIEANAEEDDDTPEEEDEE